MDDEMINRVITASFDCWNKRRGLGYTVEDMSDSEKEFASLHAIAIIKAMREPTEKMKVDIQFCQTCGDSTVIWTATIDIITNEH